MWRDWADGEASEWHCGERRCERLGRDNPRFADPPRQEGTRDVPRSPPCRPGSARGTPWLLRGGERGRAMGSAEAGKRRNPWWGGGANEVDGCARARRKSRRGWVQWVAIGGCVCVFAEDAIECVSACGFVCGGWRTREKDKGKKRGGGERPLRSSRLSRRAPRAPQTPPANPPNTRGASLQARCF